MVCSVCQVAVTAVAMSFDKDQTQENGRQSGEKTLIKGKCVSVCVFSSSQWNWVVFRKIKFNLKLNLQERRFYKPRVWYISDATLKQLPVKKVKAGEGSVPALSSG